MVDIKRERETEFYFNFFLVKSSMIHKTKCVYCHVELSDWGVKKDTLYISVYR